MATGSHSEQMDWCFREKFGRPGNEKLVVDNAISRRVGWFGDGGESSYKVIEARKKNWEITKIKTISR